MKLWVSMIVKNEESCLEKCLESVKDADGIVVVDTGSEDKTCEIARVFTPYVYEGEYKWNDDYAEARNFALSKIPEEAEWILSVDADEYLEPNGIQKIKDAIAESHGFRTVKIRLLATDGISDHWYPRVFKKGVKWIGMGHEAPDVVEENRKDITITYGYSDAHKKDPDRMFRILTKATELNRSSRNLYYLAREYWYRKDYDKAIELWDEYLHVGFWKPERADAWLMMARCYWLTGRGDKARECCANALLVNAHFEEACLFMAELSWPENATQWRHMAETANNQGVLFVRVPKKANIVGEPVESQPSFYPKVSIVIPTLGRPEKLSRLVATIKKRAGYNNYEIVVEHDSFKKRQGCPKTLKKGVEKSTGELVMFLGNDCVPEKNFLRNAVKAMSTLPQEWGMVGLNDGVYGANGTSTHWLASRKLLPFIGGEFFCTEYEHCFCDNELKDRVLKLGRYTWAEDAKIHRDNAMNHGGKLDEVLKIAYDKERFERDRATYERRKVSFK